MKSPILLVLPLLAACSSAPGPVVPGTPVERKMIGLLSKFDLWDLDGDGALDVRELDTGLRAAGADNPAPRVMKFYDLNGDQRVSLAEAQSGYQRAGVAEDMVRERRGDS